MESLEKDLSQAEAARELIGSLAEVRRVYFQYQEFNERLHIAREALVRSFYNFEQLVGEKMSEDFADTIQSILDVTMGSERKGES